MSPMNFYCSCDLYVYEIFIRMRLFVFPVVPPLFVIEFLHRIIDTFTEYFSECNEQRIKDHYVIVYEVRIRMKYARCGFIGLDY